MFLALLFAVAFVVNVPLGYLRENHRRMSLAWLFYIHASIPLIVYLRITHDVSYGFIPLLIITAIAGQFLGAKWHLCRSSKNATGSEEGSR